MDKKDNAELMAAEIEKKGLTAIKNLIDRQEAERFFLDFKRVSIHDYVGRNKLELNDHKNLAKAISGFGNSEGGILIWGIEVPSNREGLSNNWKLMPINGAKNFASLLESYVRLSTIPAHTSVRSFCVSGEEEDKSFVVTVIPKSNAKPHQYIVDSENKYYMRAGDSFLPVPHGVLQGMFGHRPVSEITLMYTIGNPELTPSGAIHFQIGLMLMNGSTGIARDIYGYARIWVPGGESEIGVQLSDQNNYDFQQALGVEFSFMSKPDFRLGYHQRSQPLIIDFCLQPPFTQVFTAQLCIGARDQEVCQKEVTKNPEELKNLYDRYIKDSNWKDFYQNFWDSPEISSD